MTTDAGREWFDLNMFYRIMRVYHKRVVDRNHELTWIVPIGLPHDSRPGDLGTSIYGIPAIYTDVDRVYLGISEKSPEEKKDDLYNAFRAGWMKGLDESKNVDELYAEWKKNNE